MTSLKLAKYKIKNGTRAFNRWIVPYIGSKVYNSRLRPVVSFMVTDWKCNINCGYCFQHDNKGGSMSLETAYSSIDWLKSIGCRVVGIMGGEPLIRKDFILKVIKYGSKKGMFMYLPTNGYLMDKEFIDKLGKAEVAAINLAVDCVAPKPGLPKALKSIEPQFKYLVSQQENYGYILFFNMNITSKNLEDVKKLTEIAYENGIGMDYHVNEPPQEMINTDYAEIKNDLLIRPDQYQEVDELIDWLIKKQKQGYVMVNSISHLQDMKKRMRNIPVKWDCRAGHNGILINSDGSLAPCFDLITYNYDWGKIGNPKFDKKELIKVKEECLKKCLSTCFYSMGHYYQPAEAFSMVKRVISVGGER